MKRMEIEIRVPDRVAGHLTEKSEELGIDTTELASSLITHNIATYQPRSGRHFLVPATMSRKWQSTSSWPSPAATDRWSWAPTGEIPFAQAVEQFEANGLTEEQILEVIKT